MAVKMEIWGDYALFSRPELKVERVSYDVPTPSAARGMLESVYYHPGLKWTIDRIHVLNPIQFTNLRRNEVKSKLSASLAKSAMTGKSKAPLFLAASEDIVQRAAIMLKNVHYVIEAHFDIVSEKAAPGDNAGKFQDIVKRRLKKGTCYAQPYLGTRECTAHFRLWEGGEIPAIQETRDLGLMLYDMDYSDLQNITPMFFRAQMVDGIIDLRDCEVYR
ncbi:MAG: type I-C CRISPR-associated protein Cas5c [Clostridia bacterium]|nr:type I-C CRISPR-associated protein Cas5c [Clostridia bacterium]